MTMLSESNANEIMHINPTYNQGFFQTLFDKGSYNFLSIWFKAHQVMVIAVLWMVFSLIQASARSESVVAWSVLGTK